MNNLNPNIPVHDGRMFQYNSRKNRFFIEASTLLSGNYKIYYDAKIYLDAADCGFYIKSPRTGEKKLFGFLEYGNNKTSLIYQELHGNTTVEVWND